MQPLPPLRFCEAINKVFRQNYANFNGRARRSEYWFWALFGYLVELILAIPILVFQIEKMDTSIILTLVNIIYYGFAIIIFIPSLAVSIRRLHDIGKSGWWLLIGFIPIIGAIILLIYACFDSEKGPNEWGDSPKYIANSENQEHMVS